MYTLDISSWGANSNRYESSVGPAYETITDRAGVRGDTIQTLHNPVYNGIVVRSGSDIPVTTYPVYAEIGQIGSNIHAQRSHTIDVLSTRTAEPQSPLSETGSSVSQVPSPYLVPQRSPGAARAKSSQQHNPSPCTESASHQLCDSQNTNYQCTDNQHLCRDKDVHNNRNAGLTVTSDHLVIAELSRTDNAMVWHAEPPPPIYESIKVSSRQHPPVRQNSRENQMQLQTNSNC